MIAFKVLHQQVPAHYMGVWQRTLLQSPTGLDTTFTDTKSLVLWMQTQHHHIDIRIPANLHQLRKVNQLTDYSVDDLHLLAQQQGFAGITQVNNDICQWHREMDFQPDSKHRDIGKMVFRSPDFLIETGCDADYLEHWQRLPNSQMHYSFKVLKAINRHGLKATAYLMRAGQYIAYIRPRSVFLPQADSLIDAIRLHQPDFDTLCDWLDMEISFGRLLDEKHWEIKHATLPFKEHLIVNL